MGLAKDCWFSKDLRPKAVDFSQFEQLLKSTIQKHKSRQKHSHLVSQWPNSNIKIPVLMADSPGHAMHVGDWSLSFKYPTSGTRESPKMQRDRSFVCNVHRTCRTCSICRVPSKFHFWLGYFTLAWPMQSTAKMRLEWKLLDGQPWLESGDKPKTLSQLQTAKAGRHEGKTWNPWNHLQKCSNIRAPSPRCDQLFGCLRARTFHSTSPLVLY